MATRPRSLDLCYRLIDRLENENAAISDALHKMSNECAVMLSNKDREMLEKCKACGRGVR